MDWLKRMNNAMEYIESNLAGEIDYNRIAELASCSIYNFQRVFSYIIDIPLSEYRRRRRFTLAAFELQNTNIKVIDLAYKYGYQSPEAFARTFQNIHGVTPSSARKMGVNLKAYPRISFQISIKGDLEMDYRIEKKDGFSIFGVEEIFLIEDEDSKQIPKFWLKSIEKGTLKRIEGASDLSCDESLVGIKPVMAAISYRDTGENTFPYLLSAFTPESGVAEGFDTAKIPALTWAIFKSEEHSKDKTSQVIQDLWKRIYSEWFPTADYEPLGSYELELYGISENGKDYCEIWIPLMEKACE
ncbi:AraC family transcriptional regulator [Natronospora cellulosivora (SeqCode)]